MMYKYNYPDLGSYTYGIYALVSQKKKKQQQTNKQTGKPVEESQNVPFFHSG